MAITTQNRIGGTVDSMPGDWAKIEPGGGKFNSQTVRVVAGGPRVVLGGEAELETIVTTRIFDPVRDASIVAKLVAGNRFENSTITQIYADPSGVVSQQAYGPCTVDSWKPPSGDANSDDPAELEITWMVSV